MVKNIKLKIKGINIKFNKVFLAIILLIIITSQLSACGMKRALYLPEKETNQDQKDK